MSDYMVTHTDGKLKETAMQILTMQLEDTTDVELAFYMSQIILAADQLWCLPVPHQAAPTLSMNIQQHHRYTVLIIATSQHK